MVLVGVVLAENGIFEKNENERPVRSVSAEQRVKDAVHRFVRETGVQGRGIDLGGLISGLLPTVTGLINGLIATVNGIISEVITTVTGIINGLIATVNQLIWAAVDLFS